MFCPKCAKENDPEDHRCIQCGSSLAIAVLEVTRGNVDQRIHFLKPRNYTVGRARHNDLSLIEPSISKAHARITYQGGRFEIEDAGSLHGVYVNAVKTEKAELKAGSLLQLGNVTLKFAWLTSDGKSTDRISEFPWIEQQQLLLSLVQTLNSTLVLSQVLEQVLEAVMRITRAERGFLLLAEDGPAEPERYQKVAGLQVRVGRRKGGSALEAEGISTSVVKRALQTGQTVATGDALADPSLADAHSIVMMDLRTIVCIPLRSPRADLEGEMQGYTLGALYVDNQRSSAPFSADSLRAAEALARHASLAIENAQFFEREKKTIEELRVAQQQLLQAEKLATIGQMAAGIAHELNTPLTYIMGNLELMQGRQREPSEAEMLHSIGRGAERIKDLAQSLLAFSRPSQEAPRPLAPNEVIERSLELCHYQVVKGGVRLERQLSPSLPKVMGVSDQLEMALINLIVNAIQAMAGSSQRQLVVSSGLGEGEVQIGVADTGPGIPEDVRASVFEPFVTTKPEGQGTGLGLSTVLMVVQGHQGRIDFTTQMGVGTSFRIRLPAVAGS